LEVSASRRFSIRTSQHLSILERMAGLNILLIGDPSRDEFRAAADDLPRYGAVSRAAGLAEAERWLDSNGPTPDVIVLAQALPDQLPIEAVERLRRRVPLARVVGLLGSWCEGEMRSGRPWPAVVRVYWHQWFPVASEQLAGLAQRGDGAWSLPITATDEERLLVEAGRPLPTGSGGLVAVATSESEMADWLLGALGRAEYAATWWDPRRPPWVERPTAAVYDMADTRADEIDRVRKFVAAIRPAPVLALMHFPRPHEMATVRAAGVAAVVSKPLTLSTLSTLLTLLTTLTTNRGSGGGMLAW